MIQYKVRSVLTCLSRGTTSHVAAAPHTSSTQACQRIDRKTNYHYHHLPELSIYIFFILRYDILTYTDPEIIEEIIVTLYILLLPGKLFRCSRKGVQVTGESLIKQWPWKSTCCNMPNETRTITWANKNKILIMRTITSRTTAALKVSSSNKWSTETILQEL